MKMENSNISPLSLLSGLTIKEATSSIAPIEDSLKTTDSVQNVDVVKSPSSTSTYDGDYVDETPPPGGKYQKFDFPNPALLVSFFDQAIASGPITLWDWQKEVLTDLGSAKATSKHPYKYILIGNNGSGKDKFIIAPFAVWFTLTKIRARVIITTASGNQLTSQTEPYIKDLAEKVNAFFGQEVYRIRQRYIKCLLTGSEIRLFVTDEKGKAEGYHPMDTDSEMAIVVNEWKSVDDEITKALRRCTGYNYWLGVSSTGEHTGAFYRAAITWPNVRRVTSLECPHISDEERLADLQEDGEHSAYYRSKHLSLFTSIGGTVIIPLELVNDLLKYPPKDSYQSWPTRIGLDLAAGGDENVISVTKGNKCIKEIWFHERDTTVSADVIEQHFKNLGISKNHQHIYADDGGIGRGIIDILVRKGWNINRIMNQWAALGNKKQYGNRGAENWYRCKRILEERVFNISNLSEQTIKQLTTRYYKQTLTGGRIFLEQKKEAKAHGRLSPDRADAFILSLTGLTISDFLTDEKPVTSTNKIAETKIPVTNLEEYYSQEVTFGRYRHKPVASTTKKKPLFSNLRSLMRN